MRSMTKELDEGTEAMPGGREQNVGTHVGVAGWAGDSWMSARWWCWTGGRVLDWDTVALLGRRQLEMLTMTMLDGPESAGKGRGGFATRKTAGERVLDWDTVALLDGRPLDERTLAVLD